MLYCLKLKKNKGNMIMDYWKEFEKLKSKNPYKSYSIINELKNQQTF